MVASLWTASDICTRKLMRQFYSHIAEGDDKAQALRRAKMDLIIEFGDDAVPFYWASFVMVGDGSRSHRIPTLRAYRP